MRTMASLQQHVDDEVRFPEPKRNLLRFIFCYKGVVVRAALRILMRISKRLSPNEISLWRIIDFLFPLLLFSLPSPGIRRESVKKMEETSLFFR